MPANDDVSHGDIYHKLGSLEGKVEALLLSLSDRKEDISNVFSRLRQVEHRLAWAMGAAVVISLIAPHLIRAMEPRLHIGPVTPQHQLR
jgi:hypothetical protein